MIYEVDMWNNFCRVFELPDVYPEGLCIDGGLPTMFTMVDWFNPTPIDSPGVTKDVWKKEVGDIEVKIFKHDDLVNVLLPFLKGKNYVKKGKKYVLICDFGCVIHFEG